MATPRKEPYVWVTWLAKLMAGEKGCEFSSWFRTRHIYDKLPSDFDVAAWTIEHARQVRELRIERLRAKETVYVGNANAFTCQPRPGVTLAGRPDLIGDCLLANPIIYGVKTGRPKTSDVIEIIIYMHLLPLAVQRYGGTEFNGCLVYGDDRHIRIPASSLDDAFITNFEYFLDVIAGEVAPPKAPSALECRSCDIPSSECPERFVAAGGLKLAYTRLLTRGELGITDASNEQRPGKVDGGGDAQLLLHLPNTEGRCT